MRLRPDGCVVTGKISLVVRVAEPSFAFLSVAYEVLVREYATGTVRCLGTVFLEALRVCLLFLICLFLGDMVSV